MSKKLLSALLLLAGWILNISAGDFTLAEKNGSLSVTFKGKEIISSSDFYLDDKKVFAPGDLAIEQKKLKDGTTVFNIWSKLPAHRFRQEASISADGKRVEINMQCFYNSYKETNKNASYVLKVPFERVSGMPYSAVVDRSTLARMVKGTIAPDFTGALTNPRARMLNIKTPDGNLEFDFSPQGVCNYSAGTRNTCFGYWQLLRPKNNKNFLQLIAAQSIPAWGGGFSGKLVITSSDVKDYYRKHPRKRYRYFDALPAQKLYSFGAAEVGWRYRKLDLQKFGTRDGWSVVNSPRIITGKHPGAFYSGISGRGKAVLKVKDLQPGYYFVTVGIGNFYNCKNDFSIKVNGEILQENITVKNRQAASITRVFKLEKDSAEIEFSGNWLISTLGVQLLTNFYEDYSFSRGFWVTEGFEPSAMYQSKDYAAEPKFRTARTDVTMPDPSAAARPVKTLTYSTSLPSAEAQKNMLWRYNARVSQWGPNNNGTFEEYSEPGAIERRMDEHKKNNVTMVLISSLLSRHTFPGHLDRARAQITKIAQAARDRGIKIYDHMDYTLLWNMDSGFRVAAENPQYLARELDTLLPTTDFCVNNHKRNQQFRKYLNKYIRDTKLDGIMIDEVSYGSGNFCGCSDCRNDFTRDTAQEWPLNESAPDQCNRKGVQSETPLAKLHRAWRRKRIGDWWVALRNAIKADHPDFGFMCYTTHHGMTSHYATVRLGLDLSQSARSVDFIGTEVMPRNIWANARPIFAYRRAQNMLNLAFGTPVFGQVYAPGGWLQAYFSWAIMNMNNQSSWAEPSWETPKGRGNYYLFGDRNMDKSKAVSCAKTALLFSTQGRDNPQILGYKQELFGTAQTLGEMHINYDIICDQNLSAEALKRYKVLFLGNSSALSDAQIAVIRDFAAQGGNVVLGPTAGLADEYGNLRKTWPFKDIFKFKPYRFNSKVSQIDLADNSTVKPKNIILGRIPDPRNVPMKPAVATLVWGKTRIPALFEKTFGKGRLTYLTIAIGSNLFQEERMVKHTVNFTLDEECARACRMIWKHIIEKAQADSWQCKAPFKVLSTLYKVDNTYYAHFLNAAGVNYPAKYILTNNIPKDAFPQLKEDIVFTLPDRNLSTAEAASPEFSGWQKLDLRKTADGVTVTIPRKLLKIYLMIRIK